MNNKINITASIVLYKENREELKRTIKCFLETPMTKKLYLIDNTSTKSFENDFNHPEIEYIGIGKNIGFGSGHNMVIEKISKESNYHLILNPDVSFSKQTVPNLLNQMGKDNTIAMIAPKVLFPNGNLQNSCRRYPSLLELIVRRVFFLKPFFKTLLEKGIYKDVNLEEPFIAEYLTGCFHLYKTDDLVMLNGFDERYFLYMEDVDICKKIDKIGKKKLYFPQEKIYHVLKKGSEKNINLFLRHTSSAIKYFKKWGF